MKSILIAGGSGAIGRKLTEQLRLAGHNVRILTRTPRSETDVYWSVENREIATDALGDVQVLINLSGAGIDQKRWTSKRKQELIDSRIESTRVLFEHRTAFPALEHYVSASGITAYGFDEGIVEHSETDEYGNDFISQLVKQWEEAANLFQETVPVACLRVAVVLSHEAGALPKLMRPIQWGIGSAIGSGKQQMPWVHVDDLVRLFERVIDQHLAGTYNTNAGNASNAEMTRAIAVTLGKRLRMPRVPSFVIRLVFGELSDILLKGAKASNARIRASGFTYQYPTLEKALRNLLQKP